jgi:predicted transposase YdaD
VGLSLKDITSSVAAREIFDEGRLEGRQEGRQEGEVRIVQK